MDATTVIECKATVYVREPGDSRGEYGKATVCYRNDSGGTVEVIHGDTVLAFERTDFLKIARLIEAAPDR